MVALVGRGEDLRFVDVVDPQGLEDLGLGEVPDAHLGHHRDGDAFHDLADLADGGHAGHTAVLANVRGHPFQGHDRHRAGVLGDLRLTGIGHVHDHATLEHLGQAGLEAQGG